MTTSEQRESGFASIGSLTWGSHLGHVVDTLGDVPACLRPFLSAGRANRERCLILAPADRVDRLMSLLAADLAGTLERRDTLRSYETVDAVAEIVVAAARDAMADGFTGLRVVSIDVDRNAVQAQALAGLPVVWLSVFTLETATTGRLWTALRAHPQLLSSSGDGPFALPQRPQAPEAVADALPEPQHLWLLESLDHVNRAIQSAADLEQMMRAVLDTLLEVMDCDRAWLVYPCDPDAPTWRVPMERTRPQYPGVLPVGVELPLDPAGAEVFRLMRDQDGPLTFGPGTGRPVPTEVTEAFGVKSFLVQALYPRLGLPWSFGLHICSRERIWTTTEIRLLQEIGRRLSDGLTSMLILRDLRASEARLAEAQAIARIGHWEHDLTTGLVTASDETRRIFGRLPQPVPLSFAQVLEMVDLRDREMGQEYVAAAVRGEADLDLEYRVCLAEGERILRSQLRAVRDAGGNPVRLFGTVQDITETRRAEENLRTLSQVIESSPVSIIVTDINGNIEYANPKFSAVSGYSLDEVIGHNPRLLKSGETSSDDYRLLWNSIAHGQTWRGEFHNRKKSGELYWEQALISPVIDGRGRILHYMAIKEDITQHKLADQNLAYRLAELETVSEISAQLRKTQARSEMMAIILDRLMQTASAEGAAFVMRDATSYEARIEAAAGVLQTCLDQRWATGEGLCGQAILTGRPAIYDRATAADPAPDDRLVRLAPAMVCMPLIAADTVIGALCVGRQRPFSEHEAKVIGAVADMSAIAIQRVTLTAQAQHDATELALAYESTIEGWSRALDLRDRETEGHTLRVTDLTLQLAEVAGVPDEELQHVRRGALLHDIGKMGVPDAILLKPGPLSPEERMIMQQHPLHALRMLSPIAYLRPALDIPHYHHEKWNGGGYPVGLRGEEIPFVARLFAIADVWDALTSDRPYRLAWPREQALAYIRDEAGQHFDPRAVELFFDVIREPGR